MFFRRGETEFFALFSTDWPRIDPGEARNANEKC